MDYKVANLDEGFLSRLYEPMSKLWPNPPPEKLWRIGELPSRPKDSMVVAIVGSRHCTDYGAALAYNTAKTLAERGVVVVSGMAYGIDGHAHRGCLDGGGKTVAVLGTPITKLYPASNRGLAKEIVAQGGAILSEFGPGDKTYRDAFRYRNRIVSGLADALLIIEAAERSGTISTANFANEQGRSVFVVPGDLYKESSAGANRLIMDGASIFMGVDEMMDAIDSGWRSKNKPKEENYTKAQRAILYALSRGKVSMDCLAEKLKLSIQEICLAISELEMDGVIKSDAIGNWSLVR